MVDWRIRPAKISDADALADCIDAAYAVYVPYITDLPAVSEGIQDDIENHLVFVTDLENRIVGGLVLVPDSTHARLANVAVDPHVSGTGIGRALIEHAENECSRLQIPELRLTTHVDMPGNVKLYEHLGWRQTGRTQNKVHMAKAVHPVSAASSEIR